MKLIAVAVKVVAPDVAMRVLWRLVIVLTVPVVSSVYFRVQLRHDAPVAQSVLPSPTYAKISGLVDAVVRSEHRMEFVSVDTLFGVSSAVGSMPGKTVVSTVAAARVSAPQLGYSPLAS